MAGHGEEANATAGTNASEAWNRASEHAFESSEHFVNSIIEANRAFVTSLSGRRENDRLAGAEEIAYTEEDWTFERTADTREELGVGDSVRFTKQIDDDDVRTYARISGDTNRLHLDEEFAEGTRFGGRIVHGGLVSGLISAALARLPGLTIYLSQSLDFHAPAEIGGELTAVCTVVEDIGDDRYRLETLVEDEEADVTLIEGEAVVLIDEIREDED